MQPIKISSNISQMHLIRAIACLGVVLTHARFVLWAGGQAYLDQYPMAQWNWYDFPVFFLDLITSIGHPRVFFFFILSGFFLQYSMRKSFHLRSFLRTRFLRLYPAYVTAALIALVVFYFALTYINPALATGSDREFNVLLSNAAADLSWVALSHTLLFSHAHSTFAANTHFWSMGHEVLFCLLFPLYRLLPVWGRMVAAASMLAVGTLTGNMSAQAQLYFLIGMLFYDFFSRGHRLPWALPKWSYLVVCVGLYVAVYVAGKVGSYAGSCLAMVLLAGLLFDIVLTQPIRVPRALVFISKASYAIYLNHMWALLLYYALVSRLTGDLVFYSRWPYYSGALAAVALSVPMYWLVDKRISAYLAGKKTAAAVPMRVVWQQPAPQPEGTLDETLSPRYARQK